MVGRFRTAVVGRLGARGEAAADDATGASTDGSGSLIDLLLSHLVIASHQQSGLTDRRDGKDTPTTCAVRA